MADDHPEEGGDRTRTDAGGGFRWSADIPRVPPPPPQKMSCVATAVFAVAAVTLLSFAIYFYVTHGWHLPRLVAGCALLAILFAVFFVVRAVDLPIARWRRRRAERDPAGAARSERRALVVAAAVVAVGAAVLGLRWRASRLDPLKEEWAADRDALVAGAVLKFDRQWDTVELFASMARHDHPGMREEIDAYMGACAEEARRIVVDRWPQVARHLGSRDAVSALMHNAVLHDVPGLADRVRQFETDLQTRGVVADVRCTGDDWAGWRDAVLSTVRDALPDAYVVTQWPSDAGPAPGTPGLIVEFAVESVGLQSGAGSEARTVLLPVKALLRITATGRPLGVAFPVGVRVIGPLPVLDTRDGSVAANSRSSWTEEQAETDRDLDRALLVLLLRRELGLDEPTAAAPAGGPPSPPPGRRGR